MSKNKLISSRAALMPSSSDSEQLIWTKNTDNMQVTKNI